MINLVQMPVSIKFGALVSSIAYLVAIFTYLVIFRLVFPDLGHPSGMMAEHDSIFFHEAALSLAKLVEEQGWGALQLNYERQPVAGVLGAFYSAFGSSILVWSVAQSLLYGIAAGLLHHVIRNVAPINKSSAVGLLLVLFLPSAAMIYIPPHNDIFVLAGYMMMTMGWWVIAREAQAGSGGWKALLRLAIGASWIFIGAMIARIFREFTADIFLAIGLLMTLMVTGLAFNRGIRRSTAWMTVSTPVVAAVLILVFSLLAFDRATFSVASPQQTPQTIDAQRDLESDTDRADSAAWFWAETEWMPSFIDNQFRQLSKARQRITVIDGHARSAVDIGVNFHSASEVVAYIPRAIQLAILSPPPNQWWPHSEASFARNFQRVLAGAEMVIVYPMLFGLLFAIWTWRDRLALWCLIIPASVWLTVYGLAVPVAGSLIRWRYPAYVSIVAIGMLGLFYFFSQWKERNRLE